MLKAYQERMLCEYRELTAKIDALTNFMGGEIFSNLEAQKKTLLQWQCSAMKSYAEALAERCLCEGFSPITGEILS